MKSSYSTLKTGIVCAAVGWMCWTAGNVCQAQSPGTQSPDLQEVVKLSQAKMPDDVIKNYITSSGKSYHLEAEDIIYLNSQGVSAGVISALQTASPAYSSQAQAPAAPTTPPPPDPTAPPPGYNTAPPPPDGGPAPDGAQPTPPPPPEVNFQYFHDQLAPFGTWITVGGVTYWRPDQAVAANPDWRPYYDMGQWTETDNGLYWQSDYTWGDIPFHYGRWVLQPGMGWLWAPDYTWGPSWVFWRQDPTDGCIGWAPLPVGALFINGGLWFHGVVVGADFNFGLGDGCFTFVDYAHFHEPFFRMRGHEWAYHIDHARIHGFWGHTVIHNEFRRDDHGRFVNDGIGRDRMEHLTHVEHASFEERNPVGDRNKLAATRDDQFRKTTGGAGGLSHGQTGNFGTDHTVKTTTESSTVHGGNFTGHTTESTSVSKVYRPPSGPSGGSHQGGGNNNNKK